jgi:hypothetical protein
MRLPLGINGALGTNLIDATGRRVADCATTEDRDHILNAVNKHPGLVATLRLLLNELPERRDWLDPNIEQMARHLLRNESRDEAALRSVLEGKIAN